jgi:SAM-dependent methyltransferase
MTTETSRPGRCGLPDCTPHRGDRLSDENHPRERRSIFQNPCLTSVGLNFYYRDFYDGLGQQLWDRLFKAQTSAYHGRAEMLRPFTTPKAWLDVGAGHGHFCQAARQVWPNTVFDGLDQSASIKEAERHGRVCHAFQGNFLTLLDDLTGRYDVVSMHHYLEHTQQPFEELGTVGKVLLPGGYLLIEVPDPEYWFGRVFGRLWVGWFQPQHQHMIPLRNLIAALADCGFSTVSVQHEKAKLGVGLAGCLALAINNWVPDPRLPWLITAPTGRRRLRHIAAWVSSIPLLVSVYVLGNLFHYLMCCTHRRQTYRGDVYRVLARKDS